MSGRACGVPTDCQSSICLSGRCAAIPVDCPPGYKKNDTDYDVAALGWNVTVYDHGKAVETDPTVQKKIYDTETFGYTAAGHTFGDLLSDGDRRALLEYLKTL